MSLRNPNPAARLGFHLTSLAWAALGVASVHAQVETEYFAQTRRLAQLQIEGIVQEWLATTGVPGAVIAVVEEDEILLLRGFGLADIEDGMQMDPARTRCRVGDIVRPMTAVAILGLVDSGELDLDAGLEIYLEPSLLSPEISRPITTRDLLTHTAGFDERITATRARVHDDLLPLETYLRRRMPARVRPPGLVSVPSSHGYALAGLLIERISGEPFPDHLESRLFAPLGMSHTEIQDPPGVPGHVATGYRWESGRWAPVAPDYPQTSPASALLTTGGDMCRWMRAVLNDGQLGGRRILQLDSLRSLLTRQFSNHELLPGRSLGLREGERYSPPEFSQASGRDGFSAALVLIPDQRLGLFAAFNAETDFWELVYRILDRFVEPRSPPSGPPWSAREQVPGISGFWREAAVSHSTVEKLFTLVRQDRILLRKDDSLIWRRQVFRPVAPLAYQRFGGQERLCFIADRGRARFAATTDSVLEKLAWYEAQPTQVALWVSFSAIFLAACRPRLRFARPVEGLTSVGRRSPRWPLIAASLASALYFLFIVGVAILLAAALRFGVDALLYGFPPLLVALLTLPLLAALSTLAAMVGLVLVWRDRCWTSRRRFRLTVLVVVLLAFLPFLHSWNLLGFRL